MTLSPPLAISAFLATVLAAAAWLAPAQPAGAQRSIQVSGAVYESLEREAERRSPVGAPPLSVAELVAQLAAGGG